MNFFFPYVLWIFTSVQPSPILARFAFTYPTRTGNGKARARSDSSNIVFTNCPLSTYNVSCLGVDYLGIRTVVLRDHFHNTRGAGLAVGRCTLSRAERASRQFEIFEFIQLHTITVLHILLRCQITTEYLPYVLLIYFRILYQLHAP